MNAVSLLGLKFLQRIFPLLFITVAASLSLDKSAIAQTPVSQVTVTMYWFKDSGAIGGLCINGDVRTGCTAIKSLPYPFGSTNPVTVLIEGTATNNRYLRDVVTGEMSVGAFHQNALNAQAIAARTYAYWHAYYTGTINNSTAYQYFVPRSYDALDAANRAKVDAAMAQQYYLSNGGGSTAIFSEFFGDIRGNTLPGDPPRSYLISVPEPISLLKGTNNGHGHGMSQNGAGRWARGDPEHCINAEYCPGKVDVPWSVSFRQYAQILTHYYTGIQMRSIYSPYASMTPNDRWVPLEMEWNNIKGRPSYVCKGMTYKVMVAVQNTGTTTWPANGGDKYSFEYEVADVVRAASVPAGATNRPTSDLAPGKTYVASLFVTIPSNLPGSEVNVSFDMKKNGTLFSQMGWHKFVVEKIRYGENGQCKYSVFFPSTRYPPFVTGWWGK